MTFESLRVGDLFSYYFKDNKDYGIVIYKSIVSIEIKSLKTYNDMISFNDVDYTMGRVIRNIIVDYSLNDMKEKNPEEFI